MLWVAFVLLHPDNGNHSTPSVVPIDVFPGSFRLADLSADGDIDLVVLDSGERSLLALLGEGAGGFAPGSVAVVPTLGGPTSSIGSDLG